MLRSLHFLFPLIIPLPVIPNMLYCFLVALHAGSITGQILSTLHLLCLPFWSLASWSHPWFCFHFFVTFPVNFSLFLPLCNAPLLSSNTNTVSVSCMLVGRLVRPGWQFKKTFPEEIEAGLYSLSATLLYSCYFLLSQPPHHHHNPRFQGFSDFCLCAGLCCQRSCQQGQRIWCFL